MRTAVLFPGQGSQTPDMRDRVAVLRPDLIELVGDEAFARADEDTRFAQPAIVAASLALLEHEPDAVAGHSLGELTALAVAGAISEEDAIRLAFARGRAMSACRAGGMLAVLGQDPDVVAAVAERAGLTVANDNAPGQLVLSGPDAGLERAAEELEKTMRLNVSGAFHSPLMADAVPAFAKALSETTIHAPRVPVYSGVTAAPIDDVRRRLTEALTSPVRWRETVLAMRADGIEEFVDAGPGRVLANTLKRILRPAHA
jgi:malonyl CoA-acyl carrier protein transacylase